MANNDPVSIPLEALRAPAKCSGEGCFKPAMKKPVLLAVYDPSLPAVRVEIDCPVCDYHIRNVSPEDLISTGFWKWLEGAMAERKLPKPIRELSKVHWEPLIIGG